MSASATQGGHNNSTRLVLATVTSRLDYCNAVLAGLLQATVAPLQRVQNSAVRLIFKLSSREHVTPCLLQLHWLPLQTVLHYALCFTRDVSSVSDQHRRARWCRPYTFWSPFNIVERLHAAAAAHTVRGTFVFIRRTVRMERTV